MTNTRDDTTTIDADLGAKLLMIEKNEFAALERKGWFKPASRSPSRYRIVELVHGFLRAQEHERTRGRTAAEAAEHIGVNRRRFIELVDQGAITRAGSKGYKLDQVRHEYHERLRAVASARGEDSGEASLSQTRARLATAKAIRAEYDNQRAMGGWAPLDMISEIYQRSLVVVRELVLATPGTIGHQLVGESLQSIRQILDDHLRELLNELADPTTYYRTLQKQ